MAKSKTSASTFEDRSEKDAHEDGLPPHATRGNNGTGKSLEKEYDELVEQARSWIEANQTMAMLGGFGLGVFIGVLLRR